MSEAAARDAEATTKQDDGAATMGINELVLIGTGFVLARVVYVFYFSQRKTAEADRS